MKSNTQRPRKVGDLGIEINVEWSDGPRTLAWSKLWRIILGGLDPEPTTAADRPPGAGGDHA